MALFSDVTFAYLSVFLVSTSFALLLVPLAKRLAPSLGLVDQPSGRKAHQKAIPCSGGLAIFGAFLGSIGIALLFFYVVSRMEGGLSHFQMIARDIPHLRAVAPKLFLILGTSTIILAVGLLDDRIGVRFDYRIKFGVEILMALVLFRSGIGVEFTGYDSLNGLITVLWIVGITNAFNLLDNTDGLSAGVAYLAAMMFFYLAARQDQFFVGLIFLALAGSLLGFLVYNFHPATIFMGDSGALVVGFLISIMTLLQSFETPSSQREYALLMPVIVLALPIFDTTRVVLIRLFEGRSIFEGDRRHLSHRLMEIGMSVRQAAVSVYVIAVALGLGAIALDSSDPFGNSVSLLQTIAIAIAVSLILAFAKR